MKITNKVIQSDTSFIINELKNNELEIPSFGLCAAPGATIASGIILFQLLIQSPSQGRLIGDTFPLFFSSFLGFIIFCVVTQIRGKYLSLPKSVRKDSILVNLILKKGVLYGSAWLILNVIFGYGVKLLYLDSAIYNFFQLFSLIIIWFVVIIDLGRYDLALLSSAIKQWREGGDMDALHSPQEKRP